jgi:hypothetical protein
METSKHMTQNIILSSKWTKWAQAKEGKATLSSRRQVGMQESHYTMPLKTLISIGNPILKT